MNPQNCDLSKISSNQDTSIKQKLVQYAQFSAQMENQFEQTLNDLQNFIAESAQFNNSQIKNPQQMQEDALEKFNQHSVDLEKHFIHQKSDNQKMYQDLDDLKTENDKMYQNIYDCQKKLEQLEMKIGLDFPLVV